MLHPRIVGIWSPPSRLQDCKVLYFRSLDGARKFEPVAGGGERDHVQGAADQLIVVDSCGAMDLEIANADCGVTVGELGECFAQPCVRIDAGDLAVFDEGGAHEAQEVFAWEDPDLAVRRLSSCWTDRSIGFDVRIRLRWCSGRVKTASPSGAFCSSQSASLGAVSRYPATSSPSAVSALARLSAVQTAFSCLPMRLRIATLGARWMAFCARWNWQRCHVAPPSTARRAARNPA